jgi:hypothetical protein
MLVAKGWKRSMRLLSRSSRPEEEGEEGGVVNGDDDREERSVR